MSKDSLDKLAGLLAEVVPQGLRSVRDDLENNFRSVLQAGLGKLELVTREEFAVQEAVLARTREKLDDMEQRLAELVAATDLKKSTKKKAGAKKAGKKTSKQSE